MIRYKSHTIVFLILLTFLFAQPIKANSKLYYSNGFKYSDSTYQNKLVDDLKKNGIPIIITNEGYATYPEIYKEKVAEILKHHDNRPYSEFYKKQYAENFTALLDENKIEYEVKIINENKVQVYWNYKDDEMVRKLREVNRNKIYEK